MLLQDHERLWSPLAEPLLGRWVSLQASLGAYGIIEEQAAKKHPLFEVRSAKVEAMTAVAQQGSVWQFQFAGHANSKPRFLASKGRTTAVSGLMELTFDRFGRITASRHAIEQSSDR
jgi:hypothetical protein